MNSKPVSAEDAKDHRRIEHRIRPHTSRPLHTRQVDEEQIQAGQPRETLAGSLSNSKQLATAFMIRSTSTIEVNKCIRDGFIEVPICLNAHRARMQTNGRSRGSGIIPRGGVGIHLPGEQICLSTEGAHELLLLVVNEKMLEQLCDEVGLPLSRPSIEMKCPQFRVDIVLHRAAMRIASTMESPDAFSRLKIDLAVQQSAIHILSSYSQFSGHAASRAVAPCGLSSSQLRRAIEAMDQYATSEPSLQSLARAAGCSTSHFGRGFKVSTGETPFAWLLNRRIEKAKLLMKGSTYSLAEISLEVGFSAQAQFTTAFKRVTGLTPGSWRTSAKT